MCLSKRSAGCAGDPSEDFEFSTNWHLGVLTHNVSKNCGPFNTCITQRTNKNFIKIRCSACNNMLLIGGKVKHFPKIRIEGKGVPLSAIIQYKLDITSWQQEENKEIEWREMINSLNGWRYCMKPRNVIEDSELVSSWARCKTADRCRNLLFLAQHVKIRKEWNLIVL